MCNACADKDLFLRCPVAEPKKKRPKKKQHASHSYWCLAKRKNGSYVRKAKGKETVFSSRPIFLARFRLTCLVSPELIVV